MSDDFNKLNGNNIKKTTINSDKYFHIVEVAHTGKLNIPSQDIINKFSEDSDKTKVIIDRLKRYNVDAHAIKVVIPGTSNDGTKKAKDYTDIEIAELPNCFPLLSRHLNFTPKVGELVMVFMKTPTDIHDDRFYMGPIISSPLKMDKDISTTAQSNYSDGITDAVQDISRIPSADGIYENPGNVVIEGRYNTDIIQRSSEILLRAGKFENGNKLKYNSRNPGVIQIKSNFNVKTGSKGTSVTNIISDKINLLTYDGSPSFSEKGGMTKVNKDSGVAEYIDEDKLSNLEDGILESAHQLVFGDKLVEYLQLMRKALLNHVHNGSGNKPTDMPPITIAVKDYTDKAEKLEKEMLSKNIRIN